MMRFLIWILLLLAVFPSVVFAEKILMVAPHPDDEAIALGGWLSDRRKAGDQIWVMHMTDGEAFMRALRSKDSRPAMFFHYSDFTKLGRQRRAEARKSLDRLGIPEKNRFFLGYPNGLLQHILLQPFPDSLCRSNATAQRFGIGEWEGVKRPPHPFSRTSLVNDIDEILKRTSPDVIVIPHPEDSNGDHRASAYCIRLECRKLGIRPRLIGYLVHRGSRQIFPKPYGYHPEMGLDDPDYIEKPFKYSLSRKTEILKESALRAHKSQVGLRDGFLLSFIRVEEQFWDLTGKSDSFFFLPEITKTPRKKLGIRIPRFSILQKTKKSRPARPGWKPLSQNPMNPGVQYFYPYWWWEMLSARRGSFIGTIGA